MLNMVFFMWSFLTRLLSDNLDADINQMYEVTLVANPNGCHSDYKVINQAELILQDLKYE